MVSSVTQLGASTPAAITVAAIAMPVELVEGNDIVVDGNGPSPADPVSARWSFFQYVPLHVNASASPAADSIRTTSGLPSWFDFRSKVRMDSNHNFYYVVVHSSLATTTLVSARYLLLIP